LGYVFQDGALFPHRTLIENVRYPILKRGGSAEPETILSLLDEVGLKDFVNRYPGQVSGGQRRRAAIARALAVRPSALLLDEPFVHLDRVVREKLMDDLTRLVQSKRIPTLLVTHDVEVLSRISDQISVMENGHIVQTGTRDEVLFTPLSGNIARLLGDVNILDGRVSHETEGLWTVETDGAIWKVPFFGGMRPGEEVEVAIRTGAVKILKPGVEMPSSLSLNRQPGVVKSLDRRPDVVFARFCLGKKLVLSGMIPADVFERSGVEEGAVCEVTVTLDGISLFRR
jgi:molybdate transport system ATP-binding protein